MKEVLDPYIYIYIYTYISSIPINQHSKPIHTRCSASGPSDNPYRENRKTSSNFISPSFTAVTTEIGKRVVEKPVKGEQLILTISILETCTTLVNKMDKIFFFNFLSLTLVTLLVVKYHEISAL